MKPARAVDHAREVVRAAGVLAPRLTERRAVEELERLPESDLARALVAEKVCFRVLDLLGRYRSGKVEALESDGAFANHMIRLRRMAETGTAVVDTLDTIGRALGVPVSGIKGLSARAWYAEPAMRDVGDIDLMASCLDDAVRLAAAVRGLGYTFERRELPWLKRWPDADLVYGQFKLKAIELYALPNIDIHFGGYSVRHCGLHRSPPQDHGPGLSYYTAQDNIPLLVGNAACDHQITTKDLNDIFLCLDREDVDWQHVCRELDDVALLPFFHLMLRRLKDASRLTVSQRRTVDGMLGRSHGEWPRPATHRGWHRRWLATTTHAFRLGMRHSYSRALVTALSACRYYRRPLRLAVTARRGRRAGRMPALNPWTCVRLVPVELVERLLAASDEAALGPARLDVTGPARSLSTEMTIVRLPQGDVVRSRMGDFLPTVHYTVDRRLMALAERRV